VYQNTPSTGNLLLAGVIDEGLSPVNINHHDQAVMVLDQWSLALAPGWMAHEARGRRLQQVLVRE
jgi:hypothetical protein